MLNDNFKIGVIGAGQVGSVLANFASIANKLAFLVIRNVDKLNSELSDKLDATLLIKDISEVKTLPEVIILTVRDGQLTNTIEQFLNNRMVNFANTIFFHTSGSISRNILMALEQKGAICAACHPFQTFYSNNISLLNNATWGIDCKNEDFPSFETIIRFFEGNPIKLSEEAIANKPLYHLSAVVASSFMTALISFAKEICLTLKLDPEQFLKPIIEETIVNSLKSIDNRTIPMTGPYARADIDVIKSHLNSLESYPNFLSCYNDLARFSLDMAYGNKLINSQQYNDIKSFINSK